VDRARLRITAAVTAAALSLSITPLIMESAWASSGGSSSKASSSKRSGSHIAPGAEESVSGTSSDEEESSANTRSNPKKAKINASSQNTRTKNKNTQEFQERVLKELKERSTGLSEKELTNILLDAGALVKKNGVSRVMLGALSALEKRGAVEKITNSSPTKYMVTATGHSLTSLKRPSSTADELKDEIVTLFSPENNSAEGLSLYTIAKHLGYVQGPNSKNPIRVLVKELIDEGRLTSTPEGRYILPQNASSR
jgi:hypothetical protein